MTTSTSPVTWLVVLGWVVTIGNAIVPVLPTMWAGILGSVVAIVTIVIHGKQVTAGRVGKISR